jgi:hypothetical protein
LKAELDNDVASISSLLGTQEPNANQRKFFFFGYQFTGDPRKYTLRVLDCEGGDIVVKPLPGASGF